MRQCTLKCTAPGQIKRQAQSGRVLTCKGKARFTWLNLPNKGSLAEAQQACNLILDLEMCNIMNINASDAEKRLRNRKSTPI